MNINLQEVLEHLSGSIQAKKFTERTDESMRAELFHYFAGNSLMTGKHTAPPRAFMKLVEIYRDDSQFKKTIDKLLTLLQFQFQDETPQVESGIRTVKEDLN